MVVGVEDGKFGFYIMRFLVSQCMYRNIVFLTCFFSALCVYYYADKYSGGGRGRGPDLSGVTSLLSNIVLSSVTPNFSFYLYSIQCCDHKGHSIDSLTRRGALFNQAIWGTLLKDLGKNERADLERVVFFNGSFFYSARPIQGLEFNQLPKQLLKGETSDGDSFAIQRVFHYKAPKVLSTPVTVGKDEVVLDYRCKDCVKAFPDIRALLQHCGETGHSPAFSPDDAGLGAKEAEPQVFLSYVNCVLSRALGERLAKWGRNYVDPSKCTEPQDRYGKSLGVKIYEAYYAEFGLVRPKSTSPTSAHLALTVDLCAKVLRSESLLEQLYEGSDPKTYKFTRQDEERAKRRWNGTQVIYKADKKVYSVVALHFDKSPASFPVNINGKDISHADYFKIRKKILLKYPNVQPMVECLGRRKNTIFLPAELVCGDELDRKVRESLPMIASFTPERRNQAIEEIKNFLKPGAQKTKGAAGLLPACGIVLKEDRLHAKAYVLPVPILLAAGVKVPPRQAENWAPVLSSAKFNMDQSRSIRLNIVVFYSKKIQLRGARSVYNTIEKLVNGFQASYAFGGSVEFIETDENERHWGIVEKYLSGHVKENLFVIDFTKPRGTSCTAYPVVKQVRTEPRKIV